MPIYTYTCQACNKEVDIIHKWGSTKRKCPKCGELRLKRNIGNKGVSARFKGKPGSSGFYELDYKKKG